MDKVSAPCPRFVVCKAQQGKVLKNPFISSVDYEVKRSFLKDFRYATRHEPLSLEEISLECISYPTMTSVSTKLNPGFLVREPDGISTLSREQLTAVSLVLNAHFSFKTFKGAAEYNRSNDEDLRLQTALLNFNGFSDELRCRLQELCRSAFPKADDDTTLNQGQSVTKEFRRGFWLGDCHAYGKTRIIAGILAQYTCWKTFKAIYVARSNQSWKLLKAELKHMRFEKVLYHDVRSPLAAEESATGEDMMILFVPYGYLQYDGTISAIKRWVGVVDYEGLVSILVF